MQLIYSTHITHTRGACPRRNRRRVLTLATTALLSLAGVGCGGDGPVAPGLGTGSMTASGAVSASGSGLALFQSVSSGSTSVFQIFMAPVSQSATTWSLQIVNYSGRLAAGAYDLSPLSAGSSAPTASFFYTSGGNVQMFNSTSGQLVITSSSSSVVRGTFTFTAMDSAGGTSSVTATGSFDAQCTPGITCQ